jgi:predicted GNAT family N-acyltransferase
VDRLTVFESPTLEDACDALSTSFKESPHVGAILLSDILIDPHETWRPEWRHESALRALAADFAHLPYVSVAVAVDIERVPDVDWVLPRNCDLAMLLDALEILAERLHYFMPPAKNRGLTQAPTTVIRTLCTQTELRAALKLRYSVYRIMGYLDDAFLKTKALIELNWCDSISRHFGLFLLSPTGHEQLIGTARLVLTKLADPQLADWWTAIARSQSQLKPLLEKQRQEMAQFKLPVLQTLKLNDELSAEALSPFPWAEISRVIVRPDWRGYGFANRLVQAAIDAAQALDVQEIFLECLEIHAPLYAKAGFAAIGQRGEVMGIGKTMVGMRFTKPNSGTRPHSASEHNLPS